MATLDKTSVRKEIDHIKADFEALRAKGKVTSESLAVMNSLFMIVELILSIFLERTTRKNNTNSRLAGGEQLRFMLINVGSPTGGFQTCRGFFAKAATGLKAPDEGVMLKKNLDEACVKTYSFVRRYLA